MWIVAPCMKIHISSWVPLSSEPFLKENYVLPWIWMEVVYLGLGAQQSRLCEPEFLVTQLILNHWTQVTLLSWTCMCEWYMARLVVCNRHQKTSLSTQIGSAIYIGPIVNTTGRAYVIIEGQNDLHYHLLLLWHLNINFETSNDNKVICMVSASNSYWVG